MKAKYYLWRLEQIIIQQEKLQSLAKPNRVESLFTTAQHALDRTRKVTILAKHNVTETEISACWEEHDVEGKKPLCSQGFFVTSIIKHCFCISRNTWFQKFKTLEKNEKIDCMLHCYKIKFNFLQKKFSKHLLHNIIVAYAYIAK